MITNTRITLWLSGEKEELFRQSGFVAKSYSGCNSYSSLYEAQGDGALLIKDVSLTDRGCEPPEIEEQEIRYRSAIGSICAFEIKQNSLRLFYDDRKGVLNYVDMESAVKPRNGLIYTWASLKRSL